MSRNIRQAKWSIMVLLLLGIPGTVGADDGLLHPRIHVKGRINLELVEFRPWQVEVRDEKTLIALWRVWGVPGAPPKVDFRQEMVLAWAQCCSNLEPCPRLAKGDLSIAFSSTADRTEDAAYFIAVYPLHRVKTIGGKPRPQ